MSLRPQVPALVGRSHLRRHWHSLVVLGLVAGLVGGISTAALSGARRTSTAYDRLVEASDHPDAFLQLIEADPDVVEDVLAAPSVERAIDTLFVVGRRMGVENVVLFPVQAPTSPMPDPVLRAGRALDPRAADEVIVSERFAGHLQLEVGDVWPYQALTHDEFADLLRGRHDGSASGLRIDLRVVGIARTPTDTSLSEFPFLLGTPALHEQLDDGPGASLGVWVDLAPGAGVDDLVADVPALAAGSGVGEVPVIDFGAQRRPLDRSVAVLVTGLVAFGVVTAGAGTVVVGQMASRAMQRTSVDRRVLRELGLTRGAAVRATAAAGALAAAVAVLTTVVVAVAGSAWTPIGVARGIEPDPGVAVHVPIVVAGTLGTVLLLVVLGTAAGWRSSAAQTRPVSRPAGARLVALRSSPVPSIGTVLAFGGGGDRRSRPDRTAFAGVVAAVAGIVAALVFASSLDRLVQDTDRWGWVADHDVELPEPVRARTLAALDAADDVEAAAELRSWTAEVDGRVVDAYWLAPRKGRLEPAVVDGRVPAAADEVALGPALLDDLDLAIGDEVSVDGERRRIVGSTLPFGRVDRSGIASGVLVGAPMEGEHVSSTGLVRFGDGVDHLAAAERLYGSLEFHIPDPPVDVVNLGALRPLPDALAGVLALVGVVALVQIALGIASRSRADLAVLRAIGMSQRTTARTVLVATALVGVLATVIGVTLGLVAGRLTWGAAAATTDLATDALAPLTVWWVVAAVGAGVLFAGAGAGHRGARRPPAQVLRSE